VIQSCTYCQSEVHDQIICPRCVRVVAAHLADMRMHAVELNNVMIKDTNYAAKSDGGKSADQTTMWQRMGNQFLEDVPKLVEDNPIATPYQKAAAALSRELKAMLVSWTRLLWEERQIAMPTRDTIPALADHLKGNMRIIAGHEAAGEFVAEIAKLVKQIMVVIDAPPFRGRVKVPEPCPEPWHEGGDCEGLVIATFPADTSLPPLMTCQRCKHEWTSDQWSALGDRMLKRRGAARVLHNVENLLGSIFGKNGRAA